MAAPGTLIPTDIFNLNDPSIKPSNSKNFSTLQSTNESRLSYPRPMSSDGESSSQSSAVRNDSSSSNVRPYFGKSDYMSSNLSLGGETGVGPSKVPGKATSSKLDNFLPSASSSLYKGTRGMNTISDGTRLNVNVVPYGQNGPDDSRNLFADLNPFQIKGTGKFAVVHNKPVENKAPEHHNTKENNISGRPPVPLMWKNRYAYNEVPRKPNRNPNEYNPSSSASNSSSGTVKNDVNNSNSSYYANINRDKDRSSMQIISTTSTSGSGGPNMAEDFNAEWNKGNVENSHNDMIDVKEWENNEVGFRDWGKGTDDRLVGNNLKLKEPESPSSSIDPMTNRVDQILDDVDVGECEIPWEDLVLGERIGLGNFNNLLLFSYWSVVIHWEVDVVLFSQRLVQKSC